MIYRDCDGIILKINGSIRKKRSLKSKIDEREKENQNNETVLECINDNVVLTEPSVLNENQKNLEEEYRKLKEKLFIIELERQDLRIILETKELHEEEERIEIRRGLEHEWELERRAN